MPVRRTTVIVRASPIPAVLAVNRARNRREIRSANVPRKILRQRARARSITGPTAVTSTYASTRRK